MAVVDTLALSLEKHPEYKLAYPDVKKVRDFLEGEPTVKNEGSLYLPHPNTAMEDDPGQRQRYLAYLMGGEVDDFPARTMESMIGKMNRNPAKIELPDSVAYLDNDSDGDWLTLQEAIEITAGNMLAVNFHILLAEYTQIPEDVASDMSVAQKRDMNARAYIKHYTREQLFDWGYKRMGGRLQLAYVKLVTQEIKKSPAPALTSYTETIILELFLTEEDGYFQRERIYSDTAESSDIYVYPRASGQKLNYIPVEILTADRTTAGRLPVKTGYIAPLVYKAHHRYQVSADLKEKLRIMQDTSYSSGWTEAKKEEFNAINGRTYFAFGAGVHNFMPQEVTIDILKMQADGDAHFKYLEQNAKQVQALGGRFNINDNEITATEVVDNAQEEISELNLIANNIESGLKRLICYCAEFEGVQVKPDDFELTLNREFMAQKMTPDEVKAVRETYLDGLINREQAVQKFLDGGWLRGEIDEILSEIDSDLPNPVTDV